MYHNLNKIISYFFFSNIYLGIIAVGLCIETNLQSGLSLNFFPFYIVTFLGTCLYYSMIYVRSVKAKNFNERNLWYQRNLAHTVSFLKFIGVALVIFSIVILLRNRYSLPSLSLLQWMLLAIFPLLGCWYTFTPRIFNLGKIRQVGLLKPFVIGLTWSGFVTFYPIFIWQIQKGVPGGGPMFPPFYLWLQNFLFISILAIIFDIKDYRIDLISHLNTYPVVVGIRNTMRLVALPCWLINVLIFACYVTQQHFSISQVLVQAIPYSVLLVVILMHRQPKSLLYYLAGIDGLMLLKAVCGIFSILFFKKMIHV